MVYEETVYESTIHVMNAVNNRLKKKVNISFPFFNINFSRTFNLVLLRFITKCQF